MKAYLRTTLLRGRLCVGRGTRDREYPERAVQLISPFPAGGAADVLARYLGKEMEASSQAVIILNKPGAGTIIGAQAVTTAPPDGYTLPALLELDFSANPAVYAKLPYDPATDFEPIGMVATLSLAILTQAGSPLNNVGELVAAAKADPKNISSPPSATRPHRISRRKCSRPRPESR